jgi:phytoene desaturase
MVFLGTSPFKAPALYSLMSALDFSEGVFYPQGGIYTLIEKMVAISESLGVSIHYNSPVARIRSKHGVARGITVGKTNIDADIVISNADLHYTETALLDSSVQTYPERYWDTQEAGPSAILMYLGVKGKLPKLSHHNLSFVDDWKKNFDDIYSSKQIPDNPSIYICKPSQTDASVAPKHHENIFVLVPLPSGISIPPEKTEELADRYIRQFEKMTRTKFADKIVSRTIVGPDHFGDTFHAWQNTALGPSHILRQSAFFRTPNKSKKVRGLYYVCGSTVPGIGLPMCLISAELLYKRLARDRKGGRVKSIETIGVTT